MEGRRKVKAAVFLNVCAVFYGCHPGRAEIVFNCNRPGSECPSIDLCVNTTCGCHSKGLGYRCEVDPNLYEVSSSPWVDLLTCQNGLCLTAVSDMNASPLCLCDVGFYGAVCDLPRYDLACGIAEMAVVFNPYQFSGVVRPLNFLNDDSCILGNVSSDADLSTRHPSWKGFGKILPHVDVHHSQCTGHAIKTEDDDYITYTRYFLVQYSRDVIMEHDELVTVTCRLANTSQRIAKGLVTAPVTRGLLKKSLVTGKGTHFNVVLFDKLLRPINTSEPQAVGAIIKMKIEISERSNFKTLMVESCFAHGPEASVKFVNSGCSLRPLGVGVAVSVDKRLNVISFTVVKFLKSDVLDLVCTVRGCPADKASQCLAPSCTANGRGKREVTTAELETVRQRFRVQDPLADLSRLATSTTDVNRSKGSVSTVSERNFESCNCSLENCLVSEEFIGFAAGSIVAFIVIFMASAIAMFLLASPRFHPGLK